VGISPHFPSPPPPRTPPTIPFIYRSPPHASSTHWAGYHASAAGGLHNAVLHARASAARAFAFFTRSARAWAAPPLAPAVADAFKAAMVEHGCVAGMGGGGNFASTRFQLAPPSLPRHAGIPPPRCCRTACTS